MIGLEWGFSTRKGNARIYFDQNQSFDWGDMALFTGFGTIALVVLYFLLLLGMAAHTEEVCARNGYPKYKITWNFNTYCTKRIFAGKDLIVRTHEVLQLEQVRNAEGK